MFQSNNKRLGKNENGSRHGIQASSRKLNPMILEDAFLLLKRFSKFTLIFACAAEMIPCYLPFLFLHFFHFTHVRRTTRGWGRGKRSRISSLFVSPTTGWRSSLTGMEWQHQGSLERLQDEVRRPLMPADISLSLALSLSAHTEMIAECVTGPQKRNWQVYLSIWSVMFRIYVGAVWWCGWQFGTEAEENETGLSLHLRSHFQFKLCKGEKFYAGSRFVTAYKAMSFISRSYDISSNEGIFLVTSWTYHYVGIIDVPMD